MTALEWDKVDERNFQQGIDRGLISMIVDGIESLSPWNGLTSVEDSTEVGVNSYSYDGIRYMTNMLPGDFSGQLKAFTYPELFERAIGIGTLPGGARVYDQPSKSFNLSYRTRISNGQSDDYKIHLLYNVFANPDSVVFETISDQAQANEFSWSLIATPKSVPGYRPTAHVSVSTLDVASGVIDVLEQMLYGSDTNDPHFPTMDEIIDFFDGGLIVYDNGDGTWTAIDPTGDNITMTDSTTFSMTDDGATYLDSDTYQMDTV